MKYIRKLKWENYKDETVEEMTMKNKNGAK